MLTQILIDMLVQIVALVVQSLPPLPPEVATVLGEVAAAGGYLAELVAKFGVIVPWSILPAILSVWLGLVAFWGIFLGIRVFLWALGR